MMEGRTDMPSEARLKIGRRGFLGAAGSLVAAPLLAGASSQAMAQATGATDAASGSGRSADGGSERWRSRASASASRT